MSTDKKKEMRTVSIYLNEQTIREIDKRAKAERRSRNSMIMLILERYFG